ncbi:MAG: TolC family protein [Candidatus Eisenbacteria bacterium]
MKRSSVRAFVALAVLVVTPGHAAAQLPPVDSLVARALQRAPSLAALKARAAEARENARVAGALADPMLEWMWQDVGFPRNTVGEEEMSMTGPQLTQALPFPGKRGAKRAAASADALVRERELAAARRDVARDVRTLYARLWALDREREALTASRDVLAALTASARERYSAGAAESDPMLAARLAAHRVDERLDDLESDVVAMGAALVRLTGVERAVGPDARVPSPPSFDSAAVALSRDALAAGSAELATSEAGVTAAEAGLRAARLERWPDFTLGAGVGFRGAYERVVTLRAGLDLPLWSIGARRAGARAAEHALEAARADRADAEARAQADAARLLAQAERSARQVRRYREQVVPDTQLAFEAAQSNYRVGRGELKPVLDGLGAWLEARTALAQREAEAYVTWAELAALSGRGPEAGREGEGR